MHEPANTWALVLAAGEGSRLRSLTTFTSGTTVPKQFCSLYAGPSLLHEALGRAEAVATVAHTCVVVAEQHRRWWEESLESLPACNVIVQPKNVGTGNGILLPLLHIVERDPQARIVLLPADHHVRHEDILGSSLKKAVAHLRSQPQEIVLLGLEPEEADPELGYIVPGRSTGPGTRKVDRFVEKPPLAQARELIDGGALWNAFIVIANAQALLSLFQQRIPEIVRDMQAAVLRDLHRSIGGVATAELYDRLPVVDFSRDVLPGQEARLQVLSVPQCGWSDLGTPKRVAQALSRPYRLSTPIWARGPLAHLSLAAQHERSLAHRN